MNLSIISHYATRIRKYGLAATAQQVYLRAKKLYFIKLYKKKSLQKISAHNWEQIKNKNSYEKDFDDFIIDLGKKDSIMSLLNSTLFQNSLPKEFHSKEWILAQAQKYAENNFEILASKIKYPTCAAIEWQKDIKIKKDTDVAYATGNELCKEKNLKFYSDIKVNSQDLDNFKDYQFDIKVPWELSRFNHIFILGKAYHETLNPIFAKAFKNQIECWIDENPFLLGVNWVCAMEVAIRSINWIYGFYFFHKSPQIDNRFWKKFICSIYNHSEYLKYNSEKSFRPHNHYLSDLIGHLYIAIFLEDLKEFKKIEHKASLELEKELSRQIQDDGTSYEGSTSYHKLVTEIYLHFYLVSLNRPKIIFPAPFIVSSEQSGCKSEKLPQIKAQLKKMYQFLIDCTDHKGNFIQIGDNDSGKIVCGLQTYKQPFNEDGINQSNLADYANFGISIIKNKNWHISLRHGSFNPTQPSGHFHHDDGALTLSIRNIPILVDPGSFIYTANPSWRNYFRKAENHCRVWIAGEAEREKELFELKLSEKRNKSSISSNNGLIIIKSENIIKLNVEFSTIRTIRFDNENNILEIEDSLNDIKNNSKDIYQFMSTLVFHPDIKIENKTNNEFLIFCKNSLLAKFVTNLDFYTRQGFYSPKYGEKISCNKLVSSIIAEKKAIIRFELLDKN